MSFVHLHTHSEFSLLDGASRVSEMVRLAAETGMPAIALTDHGVLYGAIDLYLQAKAAKINPIIGQEVYVAGPLPAPEGRTGRPRSISPDPARQEPGRLSQPDQALQHGASRGLLLQAAYRQGTAGRAHAGADCALELPWRGGGEPPARGRRRGRGAGGPRVPKMFGDDYFLEIQDHGMEEQARVNEGLARSVTAHRDSAGRHQRLALHPQGRCRGARHPALPADRQVVSDQKRMRFHNDEFYLKTPAEMAERFRDFPEGGQKHSPDRGALPSRTRHQAAPASLRVPMAKTPKRTCAASPSRA